MEATPQPEQQSLVTETAPGEQPLVIEQSQPEKAQSKTTGAKVRLFKKTDSWIVNYAASCCLANVLAALMFLFAAKPKNMTETAGLYVIDFYMVYLGGAVWSSIGLVKFAAILASLVFTVSVMMPAFHNRKRAKRALLALFFLSLFTLFVEDYFTWLGNVKLAAQYSIPFVGAVLFVVDMVVMCAWYIYGGMVYRRIDKVCADNQPIYSVENSNSQRKISSNHIRRTLYFLLIFILMAYVAGIAGGITSALMTKTDDNGMLYQDTKSVVTTIGVALVMHIGLASTIMARSDKSKLEYDKKIVKWCLIVGGIDGFGMLLLNAIK